MGHTQVPASGNPLYGFTTDLKEQLSNHTIPRWLKSSPIHVTAKHREIGVKEAFEKAAQKARDRRQRLKESERDYDTTGITHEIQFHLGRGVPNKISDKLNVTRKDGQEYTGFHDCNPREYRLVAHVGTQGGVQDVEIVRDFHH